MGTKLLLKLLTCFFILINGESMNLIKSLTVATLISVCGFSSIASANTGGSYVGGDFGSMDGENGWRVFGGYGINQNMSFEGGYASYYSEKGSDGVNTAKVGVNGFEVAGVYKNPLSGGISLLGKVGMSFWKSEVKLNSQRVNLLENDGKDFFIGFGLEYSIQNNIGIRGEMDLYQGDIDETRMSVGVVYNIK